MTCGEFEHGAGSLTLWELSKTQDHEILGHAGECQRCSAWLQQQRTLAATMQTLQARTADSEAGVEVERALLRTYRQAFAQAGHPEATPPFTPIAVRLSRFFEIGAYVAVAAAIMVALFLGVRIWKQRIVNVPVQSKSVQPSIILPSIAARGTESVSNLHARRPKVSRNGIERLSPRQVRSASQSIQNEAEPFQPDADSDYVALMFCDPLSCSGDAQVVRMELQGPGVVGPEGEKDAQTRIADVVVGYDGVVRAVRIVN